MGRLNDCQETSAPSIVNVGMIFLRIFLELHTGLSDTWLLSSKSLYLYKY